RSFWFRLRLQDARFQGKKLAFLVLRHKLDTVQAVISARSDEALLPVIEFVKQVPLESIVDLHCSVVKADRQIEAATVQFELSVQKLFCFSRRVKPLPFVLKDANRPETDAEGPVVSQDTRLDARVLDLRTLAMQAVCRISSETCQLFREFLNANGFTEIHSPKIIGGTSEGGSNVFKLSYFGSEACLAQSPQLYKQMAICGDLGRVYEIAPVFRAENSNTHRHMCEFVGLDLEMEFQNHYSEVRRLISALFFHIFEGLNARCAREIATIFKLYPREPFQYKPAAGSATKFLEFTFAEGCEMLRAAGHEIPADISEFDINTTQEKELGALVKQKFGTDFYAMYEYPTAVRAFYSMPKPEDPVFSHSYDFFMRGEEILSGAQRIHDSAMLEAAAVRAGINPQTIRSYIEAFQYGSYMHGGCGVGLERVVMLFLGLNNIRKTSMFPRDPKRLAP
uniref:Aspartate--tRNA ligase, cytoplasmic n=1 Tax=Dermatophagoides pteronyssinus TaxID=6956 RepID=A0A6P6Y8E6_DERPT